MNHNPPIGQLSTGLRIALSVLLLAIVGLPAVADQTEVYLTPAQRVESKYLPNLIRVHPKVYSGGLPSGDEAFQELAKLGVRTVISVDAAKPDVAAAKRSGLRYVHLPHGYDGISSRRMAELAKAVDELEGPIYIHCHHGKHRSPAASSVACVAAGFIPESMAISILELAGTDPHYRGLYQAARQVRPLSKDGLSQVQVDYREIAEITPLAEDMLELEEAFDLLKQIEKAGWNTPVKNPSLEPASNALLLAELFAEMLRNQDTAQQPQAYRDLVKSSRQAATKIFDMLKAAGSDRVNASHSSRSAADLHQEMKKISDNCQSCHHQYRDHQYRDQ